MTGKAPDAFRNWLAALPEEGPDRLASIGRLLARVGDRETRPETFVAMLDQIRLVLLPVVDGILKPGEGGASPHGAESWRKLGEALTTMGALRTMYRRATAQANRDDDQAGTGTTPRALVPLVRALDLQARIIAGLLLQRVEPLAEDWSTLCLLGRQARAADRLDVQVADSRPLVRPVTARALFAYPLLLRLAGLPNRPQGEVTMIAGVASRLAARVGFRIDESTPRFDHPGPMLVLTDSWSVRLDTHRIQSILGRHRERPAGDEPAPARDTDALMAALESCWIGDVRLLEPGLAQAGHGLLHFGLPRRDEASDKGAQAGPDPRQGGYVFGQWERNTIVRLAIAGGGTPVSEHFDPLAAAEQVRWWRAPDEAPKERLVVERSLVLPATRAGALAVLRGTAAGADDVPIRIGRVRSVEQLAAPGYARPRGQRLVLDLWPGVAVPVGIRLGAARFFDDAWLLLTPAAEGGMEETLIIAAGLVAPGSMAVLRRDGQDRSVRFSAASERGPGFERVGFAVGDRV